MTPPKNNKSEDSISSGVFYSQMSQTVKEVTAASYRLEEKIKTLYDQQTQLTQRFEKLLDNYNSLLERVITVEAQDVESVNETLDSLSSRFNNIKRSVTDIEKSVKAIERNDEEINERIIKLEKQSEKLDMFKKGTEDKFNKFTSLALQLVYNLLLMYIAYKIGVSPSP